MKKAAAYKNYAKTAEAGLGGITQNIRRDRICAVSWRRVGIASIAANGLVRPDTTSYVHATTSRWELYQQ